MGKFAAFRPGERAGPLPEALSLRPACGTDVEAVARISHERNGGDLEAARAHVASEVVALPKARGLLLVADVGGVVAFGRVTWFSPPDGAPANAVPAGHYLSGVVVDPAWRRRGIAAALTRARLDWIGERAREAWYFANVRNETSIALHAAFGFEEVTRDFWHPHAKFEGGVGVLFRARW